MKTKVISQEIKQLMVEKGHSTISYVYSIILLNAEVDNLEGMKPNSDDDISALKEELDLTRNTITQHRQELEKAIDSLNAKDEELVNLRKELEESTSKLNKTQEELEVKNNMKDMNEETSGDESFQELLEERKSKIASLSNELNLLKEQLQEKDIEIEAIGEERERLQNEKDSLSCSLNEVKEDLASLNASTLELMEELDFSHGAQQEQRVEIESLRKVCLVEGDAKDEIIHLKNIISGKFYVLLSLTKEKLCTKFTFTLALALTFGVLGVPLQLPLVFLSSPGPSQLLCGHRNPKVSWVACGES